MKKILYIIITESLSSLIRPRWCFSGFASPLSQKLYVSTDMEAMTMRKCRQCLFIFDFWSTVGTFYKLRVFRVTYLGRIWWKLQTHNFFFENGFFGMCILCSFDHWSILNKITFLKKCHFLPENYIFGEKMAFWPPA